MRTTSSFAFYCRSSKTNKAGLAPVELSISINGQRKFINLPIKFNPDAFNKKRQPKEIQEALSLWRTKINNYINEMLSNNIPLSTEALRTVIQTGGVKSYTIQNLFDDYLNILKKRIDINLTKGVYRKYELVKELFFKYVNPNAEVTTINNQLILSFYNDLKQKYDDSTSCGYMTKLKAYIKFALDNDRIKINPFQNVKITRGQKNIDFLTESELKTIQNSHFDNQSLERVKDLFLIMSGTGMAYADLKDFNVSDMKELDGKYFINKKRVKNGSDYVSVVYPWAAKIIKKYGEIPKISNQKLNSYIQIIGDQLGIEKRLHCHLARHTYATMLLNKGVRLETVSKTLGHKNTKITTQYYAKFLPETIVNEVAKVF